MSEIAIFVAKMFDPVILIIMGGFLFWMRRQDNNINYIARFWYCFCVGIVAVGLHHAVLMSFEYILVTVAVVVLYAIVCGIFSNKDFEKSLYRLIREILNKILGFLGRFSGTTLLFMFNTVSGLGGVGLLYLIGHKYYIDWYDVILSFIVPFYGLIYGLITG